MHFSVGGNRDKRNEPGKNPDVGQARDHGSFFEFFGYPGQNQKLDGVEKLRWDGEKIGLEDEVPKTAEDVGEISCRWR
jgi:hypothetical protein